MPYSVCIIYPSDHYWYRLLHFLSLYALYTLGSNFLYILDILSIDRVLPLAAFPYLPDFGRQDTLQTNHSNPSLMSLSHPGKWRSGGSEMMCSVIVVTVRHFKYLPYMCHASSRRRIQMPVEDNLGHTAAPKAAIFGSICMLYCHDAVQ